MFDRKLDTLNALFYVLNRSSVKFGVQDSWRWIGSSKGCYTTKDAYFLLQSREAAQVDEENEIGFKLVWNKITPMKIIAHS